MWDNLFQVVFYCLTFFFSFSSLTLIVHSMATSFKTIPIYYVKPGSGGGDNIITMMTLATILLILIEFVRT